jgi:hypothetical protein
VPAAVEDAGRGTDAIAKSPGGAGASREGERDAGRAAGGEGEIGQGRIGRGARRGNRQEAHVILE